MKTPTTYRKKPVEIQAMQISGYWGGMLDIIAWVHGAYYVPTGYGHSLRRDNENDRYGDLRADAGHFLVIPTLEGPHRADPGDYIIQGVAGEFYPCKPDIFQETYEEVTE